MKAFFIILAIVAVCFLCVIYFFENIPKMVHNLFHKTKHKIQWHPDITESYYHE